MRIVGDLCISIDYVPCVNSIRLEPALVIAKARHAVAIPLSMAHEFVEDEVAIAKAVDYAGRLYGTFTRSDVHRIVDAISYGLVDLVGAPPAPSVGRSAVERALSRHGVVIKHGDHVVVDAR